MIREIKFRGWDEQAKIMHNNFQFIKSGDLNEGGSDWIIPLLPITTPEWVENLTEHVKSAPHFRDQFKLMQYTGLKDKNGAEVFEGDVLQFADKWEWYRTNYAFKFMGRSGKELEDVQAEYDAEPMERREIKIPECYEWMLSSELQSYWEVIGNIHENPELLNE